MSRWCKKLKSWKKKKGILLRLSRLVSSPHHEEKILGSCVIEVEVYPKTGEWESNLVIERIGRGSLEGSKHKFMDRDHEFKGLLIYYTLLRFN